MRATVQALLLAAALIVGACGQVEIDEELPATTSVRRTTVPTAAAKPVAPPPTAAAPTTAPPATVGGRTCLAIFNDGLAMTSQYIQDQKGIAGADEAKYRSRAQGLADEAGREGCQVPPVVEAFLR